MGSYSKTLTPASYGNSMIVERQLYEVSLKMGFKRILLISLVILFSLAGCYTVLVHPRTAYRETSEFPRHCSDCHSSADYYWWHYPYGWYWRYPYWRSYYCEPWWWDDYWYWRDDGTSTQRPTKRLWEPRRRPSSGEPQVVPGKTKEKDEEKIKRAPVKERYPAKQKKHLWQKRSRPRAPKQKQEAEKDTKQKEEECREE